jgi:hypothetical protein
LRFGNVARLARSTVVPLKGGAMKKLVDQALATAREKPVRFTSLMLMLVVLGAIALTLGDSLGRTLHQFTH